MKTCSQRFACCLVLACFASIAPAQDWTRFRGPNGTGISQAKTIPTQWTQNDIHWKVEMPGVGHSSPVVWGDRIFLSSAEPAGAGGFHALCYNTASGAKLWQRDFPLAPFPKNNFNSFASATPAVDAERVYFSWGTPEHYLLAAFDHSGKTVWERDLGTFISQHGPAASPIVYQDRIILPNEQDGTSFLIAVDARTGKTRWQTPRKGGDQTAAYSTPCVFQPQNGKPVLIFNSRNHGISAFDPDTGAVVWECADAFDKRSVSSPFVSETAGLIFGTCGGGGGAANFVSAVRPGEPAGGRKPERAYQIRKSAPYVPTSVAMGDYIYLWSDGGVVACAKAATGELCWQERTQGNFFCSPIWVDGRLFSVSRQGDVVVVDAKPDGFKELARFPLGDGSHATPAISGGRMYLRTEKFLFSIGGAKTADARIAGSARPTVAAPAIPK